MLNSIVNGIVPVSLLIAFGFVLGKRGVFDESATAALSHVVVSIALPVSLFVAAIATPRSELSNVKYLAAIAITLIGLYAVAFVIGHWLLRNSTSEAAIQGLTVGFPDMAFVGLPVLVATLGQTAGALPVLVGNIVTSLVVVPAAVAILSSRTVAAASPVPVGQRAASAVPVGQPVASAVPVGKIVWQAVKPPLVWLPVLGVGLALVGVTHLPSVLANTIDPVGKAAGGVALVTVGLILSHEKVVIDRNVLTNTALKLVAMPLVMLALTTALGIDGDHRRALLLLAITPTATAAGMLSLRYRTYVREASPTILVTTVLSFIGYLAVLALT